MQSFARVGVIGAGVMGSGIAQTIATAGMQVRCYDPSKDALERECVARRRPVISPQKASTLPGSWSGLETFGYAYWKEPASP